jgi:hypothetical protein
MLANCRQMSADGGRMASFDQWRSAKIDITGTRKYADGRDQGGADKANSDNL